MSRIVLALSILDFNYCSWLIGSFIRLRSHREVAQTPPLLAHILDTYLPLPLRSPSRLVMPLSSIPTFHQQPNWSPGYYSSPVPPYPTPRQHQEHLLYHQGRQQQQHHYLQQQHFMSSSTSVLPCYGTIAMEQKV